jgi:hypothetical protein
MNFTPEQLEALKNLLAEQQQAITEDTGNKISALAGTLRAEIKEQGQTLRQEMKEQGTSLRGEMKEVGQTLRGEIKEQTTIVLALMKNLHGETIQAIGGLADQVATQKEVDDHAKRIEALERLQKTA